MILVMMVIQNWGSSGGTFHSMGPSPSTPGPKAGPVRCLVGTPGHPEVQKHQNDVGAGWACCIC